MKINISIIFSLLILINYVLGQDSTHFDIRKVTQHWENRIDTIYSISLENLDYTPIDSKMEIDEIHQHLQSFFKLAKLNPEKEYRTYYEDKLIQNIKIEKDSSYVYQEYYQERLKYYFSFYPPNLFEFTIMDEMEMEYKTTYKDSSGLTIIKH
jgi:hypothetical protein